MKRKSFIYLLLLLPIILVSLIVRASANDEDSWMDPDAWARDQLSLSSLKSAIGKCTCSEEANENGSIEKYQDENQKNSDVASIIYLKKFITMLFNRKHFKYEPTLQIYERSVMFTLQPSQLDKLEQLQDPRDLDSILTEVFEKVRIPDMYSDGQRHYTADASSDFVSSITQMLYNISKLPQMIEIRFILIVIAVVLFGIIVKNRFKIGLFALICGGLFIYGYLHTYLECNREMELNNMLEMLKRAKGEENKVNDSSILKFIKGIFFDDKTHDVEQTTLKNSAKLSLGFCRPDHVLIMYLNDIFLTYIQALLMQCSSTITSLNETLSFPYNVISGVLLLSTICYILKLTFKYILSPSAWMQFVHKKQAEPDPAHLTKANTVHSEDRISGENLKLLLNAINGASYQKTTPTLAVSGVQEVKEAIESPPQCESKNTETCSVETSQNNNSNVKLLDDISDGVLEDLPYES